MKIASITLIFGLFFLQGFVFCMEKKELSRVESDFYGKQDIQQMIGRFVLSIGLFPISKSIQPVKSYPSNTPDIKLAQLLSLKDKSLMVIADTNKDGSVTIIKSDKVENSKFNFPAQISAIAGSSTGKKIAVGTQNGKVTVYSYPDKPTNKTLTNKCYKGAGIRRLHFVEEEKLLTVSHSDVSLNMHVWDLSDNIFKSTVNINFGENCFPDGIKDIAIDSHGERAVVLTGKAVMLIDIKKNTLEELLFSEDQKEWEDRDKKVPIRVTFGPGNVIAIRLYNTETGCHGETICYDLKKKEIISIFNIVRDNVISMVFSPNGEMVVFTEYVLGLMSASLKGLMQESQINTIWEVKTGRCLYSISFYDFIPNYSPITFTDDACISILKGDGLINMYQLPNKGWIMNFFQALLANRMLATKKGENFKMWCYDLEVFKFIKISCPACYEFLKHNVPMRWDKKDSLQESKIVPVKVPVKEKVLLKQKPNEMSQGYSRFLLGMTVLGTIGGIYCIVSTMSGIYYLIKKGDMKKLLARILTFMPVSI